MTHMRHIVLFLSLQVLSITAFAQIQALTIPTPGDEREFLAIDRLKVTAGWNGLHEETRTLTGTYAVPKGWVILDIRTVVYADDHGNRSTEGLSNNTNVVLESEILDYYGNKIRAEASVGNKAAVAELEEKQKKHLQLYANYQSRTNFVRATVSASGYGHMWNRKTSTEEISVYVKCMYIGLPE